MSGIVEEVTAFLDSIGIRYDLIEHDPVRTIEECAPISEKIGALVVKNYFLSTRNKKNLYLCLVKPDTHFQSSIVSARIGSSRLSFASDEQLMQYLHVRPGSVGPLSLIFDSARGVHLIIDRELLAVKRLAFHPCDNSVTIAMAAEDFLNVYLPAVYHEPKFVEFNA